ncbi:hemolysin family protein [Helicobacter pylori]|uniref:hemolysin family protein n=1 Tax=Helicobacter pylori TaxID=210 RepID=UPI000FDDA572|nr:hemolysin family protein [Helicobacter pylori]RVZ73839.1 HlyC/CorC family transporter [Helicobacter pylori]WQX02223.1 hemolysin family protein [Helicobacter pylori]WRF01271.1 hemolysin family protein [Helicobacter pylori]
MGRNQGAYLDPSESILMLMVAFLLVLLNAFFVLSEFALVKVRKTRLEELVKIGNSNAKLALKMSQRLDTYLSATQLGITLSSLALGWVGEPAIAKLLAALFESMDLRENPIFIHSMSVVIAFLSITFLHVVLGEIVPKSLAIAKSEKAALFVARPLHVFWVVFYPVVRLFDVIAHFFLKKVGINPKEHDGTHSEEELKIIVGESLREGIIDSVEGEIIKNAVDFSDTSAKEIMTPRKDMVCLDEENSYEENIDIVLKGHFTRYPYCKGSKDNIIGMVHIRDLLSRSIFTPKMHDFNQIVRKMIIVPESASISQILIKMKKEQIHTALVIDEYGGTAGLLTMEDIIEEIMGEISDEYDLKQEGVNKLEEGVFELEGMLDLESVEEVLHIEFDKECEQVTLGGYVFSLLERMPMEGDTIVSHGYSFEVLSVDGARIKRLKAVKQDQGENEA